ncbi:TIGR03016 family PEP-CTERM system-associated outer membrane protein [Candidatus Accumulibacter sp. ACC007]|uniref:TIGR03016 family PEP-CTERM system-associated outer membrane protein n=1 Tax=Candidatus Accumulibacter sp. ACC007 TaxID=2823333 RepID=UPI0025B98197|nr:TIGR03016 family PEP-CTERM system-associated outer membrane protein [Candidatus Accumulibacter sp. ACC007]
MATVTATVMVQTVLEGKGGAPRGRRRLAVGDGQLRQARVVALLPVVLACAATPLHAENWTIVPSIAVSETLTDNVFLSSSSNKQGDLVTGITPSISINGQGARANLRLDYGLTEQLYLRESSQRNRQNALNAVGTLEAIEDFFFIDATGRISQQYLSAFGAVSPSNANVDSNRTETSSYSLSPYLRGKLLGWADYRLRYQATTTSSQSNLAPGLNSSQWTGGLNGSTRWNHITWALDASSLKNDYEFGRDYDATRYDVTVAYRFNPQFQVSLLGGRESNNYASLDQQTNFTRGVGFDWTPSTRTRLNATVRNRFFGTGWDINFSHRRPRSMFTFRSSKDVSLQPQGVGNTGQGNNYDAFYAIIAATNPTFTPAQIGAQTAQLLVDRGIPADSTVVNGYLNDRPQVQNLQQLTAALIGSRNTVTFTATRSEQQGLSVINGLTDDYSTRDRILQVGYGIIWAHQLSGLSSLSLSFNQQRSSSFITSSPETTTTGGYLLLSTRITPKTSANIGARRVISSGVTSYTENALTGALSHSF